MKDSVLSLGFGEFDIKQVINRISCELCPYKSQKIHVPVGSRQVLVKHCLFKVKTIEHIDEMIFK